MSVSNINSNLNSNSFTENKVNNLTNENIQINKSLIEDVSKNESVKTKTKSPIKGKKKKKKKKNRHIKIICRNKILKKSNSEASRKFDKTEDNKISKSSDTNGKVLTKIYLAQLIKKKKIFAEKVKLMKIIKRHTSAKVSKNSSLDLIRQYSQKVYNTNKGVIAEQKKRDEEKEKEKEKEFLELLGIKNNIGDFINNNQKLLPSLSKKSLTSSPIRLIYSSNNNINKSPINNSLNINKRYNFYQNGDLGCCYSSSIDDYTEKKSSNYIKFKNNNNQNLIKVQINNDNSQRNIFKKENSRAKSPLISRKEYSERLAKIKKSYQKLGVNESIKEFNRLYYLILPGNASYLIKNCMCHRIKWREAFSYASNLFNFKWQQISYGIDYTGLGRYGAIRQVVNHYENHCSISNKANMFMNLMHYCEQRNISVFKYVPFTIIFDLKYDDKLNKEEKQKKFEENLEKLKNFINETQKYIINYNDIGKYYNEGKYIEEKNNRIEFFKKVVKKRKKNIKEEEEEDYEEDNKIFNGKYLVYRDYFKKIKLIEKIPTLISDNIEYQKFKERKKIFEKTIGTNTVIEIPDTHYNGKNLWVIKAINLNRGMCIKIANNINQMVTIINNFKEGVNYNFTEKIIDENQNENKSIENENNIEINKDNKDINDNDNDKNNDDSNNENNKDNKDNNKDNNNNNKDNKDNKDNNDNNNKDNKDNKDNKEENLQNSDNKNNKNKNSKTNINDNKKSEKEEEKNNNKNENNNQQIYYCSKIIIQKYIENPLLYKGRKCDMRIWVLITHQMKVYFFKEGHLKTCSIIYDLNSKDAFSHITNYSFQKYNDNFQKFEKGNEVPFYEFQKFIDEKYPEKNYKLNKDLTKQIKEIVSITTKSVKHQINKNGRNYQFEIFGYDFMLDKNFNLFLIEINTNPGLEESSPWIKIIVPRMLDDALRLTLDQIFSPEYDFSKNYKNEEENKNIEIVLNNLKNEINPNAPDSVEEINNTTNEKKENNNNLEKSENQTFSNCKTEEDEKKEENKLEINKKKGYISPFPVPGYSEDENLWEFVCDLNSKDPLDECKNKEDYTGIKFLVNKRKDNKNSKKEEEKN